MNLEYLIVPAAIAAGIVVGFLLYQSRKKRGSVVPAPPAGTVAQVTMTPTRWFFQHSPGMPQGPLAHQEGWYFDFPRSDGVHYLVHPVSGALREGQKLEASFRVEGQSLDFKEVDTGGTGQHNAKVRLYLQRRGDMGTKSYPHYRWFSVDTYPLSQVDGVLSVPLSPGSWSSVFGTNGAEVPHEFSAAVADLQAVGMTFGGMFAGHGVYSTVPAKFICRGYSVK